MWFLSLMVSKLKQKCLFFITSMEKFQWRGKFWSKIWKSARDHMGYWSIFHQMEDAHYHPPFTNKLSRIFGPSLFTWIENKLSVFCWASQHFFFHANLLIMPFDKFLAAARQDRVTGQLILETTCYKFACWSQLLSLLLDLMFATELTQKQCLCD